MNAGTVKLRVESRLFVPVFFVFWLAVALGGAYALYAELSTQSRNGRVIAAGVIGVLVGGAVGYLSLRAWMSGGTYLLVDVPAGGIEYVSHGQVTACSLDELGELEIVEHRRNISRHNPIWYKLCAPGLPKITICTSPFPTGVRNMQTKLQRLIDQSRDLSKVRRLLADASGEGGAFRAAPDLASAVRDAVRDPDRLRVVLAALERDQDLDIRRKATELRAAIP